ncbi:hypothetical protein ABH926_005433 [Catenulispora sp. GP43]|uniref:hypothetical protein n=1 Tax=Catenulispora sp. GP43 TaxID=3156263 RepID=UPI00351668CF
MNTSGESDPVEALLADALILPDYDPSQAPTAAERIARAAARGRRGEVVCHCAHAGPDKDARQELDLISALVLNTPQAAASLSQLGVTDHAEPDDALIFACLLHLIGRDEGAQFLWQFAAGSGIPEAAQCLHLHYESNGDRHDARYWREEWQRLKHQTEQQGEHEPAPAAWHPLLPEHAAKQLIQQSLRGLHPELPYSLKATVNELVIEYDDESLGKIPRPRRRPDTLGAHH